MKELTLNEVNEVSGGMGLGDLFCLAATASGAVLGAIATQSTYSMLGVDKLTLIGVNKVVPMEVFVGLGAVYLGAIGYGLTHSND
jgi:hypothetical protein